MGKVEKYLSGMNRQLKQKVKMKVWKRNETFSFEIMTQKEKRKIVMKRKQKW